MLLKNLISSSSSIDQSLLLILDELLSELVSIPSLPSPGKNTFRKPSLACAMRILKGFPLGIRFEIEWDSNKSAGSIHPKMRSFWLKKRLEIASKYDIA